MSHLWPDNLQTLDRERKNALHQQLLAAFLELLKEERIDAGVDMMTAYAELYLPFAAWLASRHQGQPLMVGINGAQGSGKSTLTRILQMMLEKGFGKRVVSLSIDDLYMTRQQREELAASVHPLFMTRGVPGTHDVELGLQLFDALKHATDEAEILLPVFNKAMDDRYPQHAWKSICLPADIILFEGWCVGIEAQAQEELEQPVNVLEADEDSDGTWRHYVNRQLDSKYRELFAAIDILVMLQIADIGQVFEWRTLQEHKLQSAHQGKAAEQARHIMDDAQIQRFIMHYERLTRWALQEMPSRADLLLKLNDDHQVAQVSTRVP